MKQLQQQKNFQEMLWNIRYARSEEERAKKEQDKLWITSQIKTWQEQNAMDDLLILAGELVEQGSITHTQCPNREKIFFLESALLCYRHTKNLTKLTETAKKLTRAYISEYPKDSAAIETALVLCKEFDDKELLYKIAALYHNEKNFKSAINIYLDILQQNCQKRHAYARNLKEQKENAVKEKDNDKAIKEATEESRDCSQYYQKSSELYKDKIAIEEALSQLKGDIKYINAAALALTDPDILVYLKGNEVPANTVGTALKDWIWTLQDEVNTQKFIQLPLKKCLISELNIETWPISFEKKGEIYQQIGTWYAETKLPDVSKAIDYYQKSIDSFGEVNNFKKFTSFVNTKNILQITQYWSPDALLKVRDFFEQSAAFENAKGIVVSGGFEFLEMAYIINQKIPGGEEKSIDLLNKLDTWYLRSSQVLPKLLDKGVQYFAEAGSLEKLAKIPARITGHQKADSCNEQLKTYLVPAWVMSISVGYKCSEEKNFKAAIIAYQDALNLCTEFETVQAICTELQHLSENFKASQKDLQNKWTLSPSKKSIESDTELVLKKMQECIIQCMIAKGDSEKNPKYATLLYQRAIEFGSEEAMKKLANVYLKEKKFDKVINLYFAQMGPSDALAKLNKLSNDVEFMSAVTQKAGRNLSLVLSPIKK